jgi:hypothetical protein
MRMKILVVIALAMAPMLFGQTGGPVQTASVTLTSAQLQHLKGAPVQLVSAPGAGNVLNVVSASIQYKAGNTAYSIPSGGNIAVSLGAAADKRLIFTPARDFIDQTTDQLYMSPANGIGPSASATIANQDLRVSNDGNAEWTNGDGTVTITVYYTVVALQ